MKIAINAMPSSGYGGVTYLRNMLPILDTREDEHLWFVYGQEQTLRKVSFPASKVTFRPVRPCLGMAGRLVAEQVVLPLAMRRDGVDVVYTANNPDLFLAPRPRVIAIRYTEPFVFRDFYNSPGKKLRCGILRALTELSLRTCDHILCVSGYAREIAGAGEERYAGKTSVVHHGLGEPFTPNRPKPAWAPEDFLFTSAKMIGYSNLINLVEALRRLLDSGVRYPLFIAGGPHDLKYEEALKRRIAELGLGREVTFLGYIDHASMAAGMANARVFVFSSLLEACPNTLLEAMGCGAAIVASDTAPNREVASKAVAWCDGRSVEDMTEAIRRVACDEGYRSRLRHRALEQAAHFSWPKTAERLVTVLEHVYEESRERSWARGGRAAQPTP